jgi:GDPmannose 4,6-dehydratase
MTKAQKTALITGIAGQDGSYLCELLLENGYAVTGTVRDLSRPLTSLPPAVRERVRILPGSDISQEGWSQLIRETKPDEVYNLSGVSFVPATANEPSRAAEEIALPAIRLLQAVRDFSPETRVYQACSSEMFGKSGPYPQNEDTPLRPASPYGAAKAYTYFAVEQFKSLFGVFAVAGIAYNHESPRRPPHFVSRRITQGAAMIKLGLARSLKLGSLDARRDWGYAKDYARAMWRMLQQSTPESYVLATGELHTVRDLVAVAFGELGLNWRDHVEVDPALVRPDESRPLVGDPSKAKRDLGWSNELPFEELIRLMARSDLALLQEKGRA